MGRPRNPDLEPSHPFTLMLGDSFIRRLRYRKLTRNISARKTVEDALAFYFHHLGPQMSAAEVKEYLEGLPHPFGKPFSTWSIPEVCRTLEDVGPRPPDSDREALIAWLNKRAEVRKMLAEESERRYKQEKQDKAAGLVEM